MERYDVVVIGAGPAGSSSALVLARSGLSVLLIERGKTVGSKNVFGGRIYSYPLFDLIANWKKDCPIERYVTKDILSFMTNDQSLTVQYDSPHLGRGKSTSFTTFRPNFDNWLARKAEAAGATLITGIRVDDLWLEDGCTKGIIAGNDRVGADVVIAADGVVSKFTQKVGLRSETIPEMVSVGVKETIELPATSIQERFNLDENEGAACVFVGQPSGGLSGGGFLYTNKNSVSLGIVVSSRDLSQNKTEIYALQEGFKRHPMLTRLLKGGKILEYSSHMIPELGVKTLEKPYMDGFMATGDAAGFLINNGYSFRGVDLAIVSGIAAAKTVLTAKKYGNFSKYSLSIYKRLLRDNRVLPDLKTFKKVPAYLRNPRLFATYPKLLCDIAESIYKVDGMGKQRMIDAIINEIKKTDTSLLHLLRDLIGGAGSM